MKTATKTTDVVKYETLSGEAITLSPGIIRKYLVSGQGNVSDQEVMMFLALCKYQKLNPFLREVYLIKYGSEKATMVTGKETFLKRAVKNEKYQGHEAGIDPYENIEDAEAWSSIHVAGYKVPITCRVKYSEYVGRKKDGTVNRMWKEKPETMLKKVAVVQALREAFPEDFGGMYSQEEINTVKIDELPIDTVQATDQKPPIQEPKTKSTGGNGEGDVVDAEFTKEPVGTFVEGIVLDVSKKEGTKNKKPWTKYDIRIEETWYGTFSGTFGELAEKALELTQIVKLTYTVDGQWHNVTNFEIIDIVPGD